MKFSNGRWAALIGSAALVFAAHASAQNVEPSAQYRVIGAQHLYKAYQQRIYKGRMPPLLYAITITETEIDEQGNVLSAEVMREPAAAKEVGPWVVSLIKAASPFPKPGHAGRTRYRDIWLVHNSYKFQLDTLTEGQD
jgi:periplasmic protein TonB